MTRPNSGRYVADFAGADWQVIVARPADCETPIRTWYYDKRDDPRLFAALWRLAGDYLNIRES